jgi:hypothetical protein
MTKNQDKEHVQTKKAYESPAIVYESLITTRAGTPFIVPDDNQVDPADLFGNN